MIVRISRRATLVVIAALLVLSGSVHAAPGDPVAGYDGTEFADGVSATMTDAWVGTGPGVTFGAGIGAGAVEDWYVISKRRADGSLDPAFGGDGVVAVPVTTPVATSSFAEAVVNNGSALYVAGDDNGDFLQIVARDLTTGAPVSGFGSGGVATINLPGVQVHDITGDYGTKLYVAGTRIVSGTQTPFVLRLLGTGEPDTSFAGDGIADLTPTVGGGDTFDGIGFSSDSVSGDPRIVATGLRSTVGCLFCAVVVRYLDDGTLDPAFAVNGIYSSEGVFEGAGTSVIETGTHQLRVTGYRRVASVNHPIVLALDEGGVAVPAFSGDGLAEAPALADLSAISVVDTASGALVAAVTGAVGADGVVAWTPQGNLDTAFGGGDGFAPLPNAAVTARYVLAEGSTIHVAGSEDQGTTDRHVVVALQGPDESTSPPPADTSKPTVTITSPTANQQVVKGANLVAHYSCSDNVGVTLCQGNVSEGATIDTNTVGTHTFTVLAKDAAGNQQLASVQYTVTTPATVNPNPPIPEHPLPLPVTSGDVLSSVETFTMPNVAPFKQGILQRYVRLVDAKATVDASGGNLRYNVVRVPIAKVPAAYRSTVKPENVIAQKPAPGTEITTDLLSAPDAVTLTVYDPNMEPKPRACDYGDVAKELVGMELAAAKKYIAHEKCDSHVLGVADVRAHDEYVKSAVVARDPAPKGKVGKEYIFVKYAEPKQADLVLVFREDPSTGTLPSTTGSFDVTDWALTATPSPQSFTVQVVERATGRFVKGAMVSLSADSRAQRMTSMPSLSPTNDKGEVTFTVNAPDPGTLSVDATVYGANGRNAEGFADVKVLNRKGRDVTTPTGRVMRLVNGRYVAQPKLTRSRSLARVAAYKPPAALTEVEAAFVAIVTPIVERAAQQQLAISFTLGMKLKWEDAMQLAQQLLPAGFLKASAQQLDLSPAKIVNAGTLVGGATTPQIVTGANVIATGGGNFHAATGSVMEVQPGQSLLVVAGGHVIATGGGNVIATGGGNVIATGGGNFVDASKGGSVISVGGGNVISVGGGNVISVGGGNVISTGGGNARIPLTTSGLIGQAGGNVISTGGFN